MVSSTLLTPCSSLRASADPQINKYFGGTFLSATSDGDSVSFKFNGTDVWAYGAQRFNHVSHSP